MTTQNARQTNALLGYPADARLLLVNADDLGMCHAVNDAIIHSLQEGIVTSTSVMVPCPWALHAITWLKQAPSVPFGVHLTVISEQPTYRWGPVLCRSEVPSLLDEMGYFYSEARIDELISRVNLAELEREFRAQIEWVLAAGLRPTHLDSHCSVHTRSQPIFDMTLGLAREYGLALRVYQQPFIGQLQAQGYPTNDHPLMDSYTVDVAGKSERYAAMLRELPPGLSEWATHPGFGNAEMQAVEPDAWQVRQTDFDFLTSPEAREIIRQEGIILVDYRAIQELWNARRSA
ncbi:MAG: polysaccharide deacetylase family protein [Chloroflexota bacterium]|nr:MAG: hypothetical protein DIU80_03180 [Chloroflexota bacterium]